MAHCHKWGNRWLFLSPSIFECSTTMKLTQLLATSQKPMLFLCVYTDKGVKNVKVAGHNPVKIQLGEAVFTIKE